MLPSNFLLMIFIGPAGYPPGSTNLVDAIERTAGMGLNAMEVQFVRQVYLKDDKAREGAPRSREKGVQLSAHAPYYISLSSPSEETVAKSRDWILRSARAAHLMGAWIIVIHAASYSGKGSDAVTVRVIEQMKRCREVLDMENNKVVLGLETMGKKGQWGTLHEIHEVMKAVEGVQPVIDFAHLHARNHGSIRGKKEFQDILEEYDRMPTAKMHCHFSGIEYTLAGEKNHLPIDAKSPDYEHLAEILVDSGRDIALICEATDPTGDAVKMNRMLAHPH